MLPPDNVNVVDVAEIEDSIKQILTPKQLEVAIWLFRLVITKILDKSARRNYQNYQKFHALLYKSTFRKQRPHWLNGLSRHTFQNRKQSLVINHHWLLT